MTSVAAVCEFDQLNVMSLSFLGGSVIFATRGK